jgi:two-component system, sensor histidine kinase and response regulator
MILVVDDHVDTAKALARILGLCGYRAKALTCGDDLFAELATPPIPRLVILNVNMPVVDGIECLRRLRANADWRTIPVVMFTADITFQRMQEAKRLGARDYVVKGAMGWSELRKLIERYVGPRTASPAV